MLADRIDRRHVLLGSQCVQMGCAFTLTLLVATACGARLADPRASRASPGFAQAFGGPAYAALIPTLVDKEDMPNAIALNSIQFNVAVTVGPALGGIALHNLGQTWCFALNGALVSRADHFPDHDHGALPAGEDVGEHPDQHEAGLRASSAGRARWKS